MVGNITEQKVYQESENHGVKSLRYYMMVKWHYGVILVSCDELRHRLKTEGIYKMNGRHHRVVLAFREKQKRGLMTGAL